MSIIRKVGKLKQTKDGESYTRFRINVPRTIDLNGKTFVRWTPLPDGSTVIVQFGEDAAFPDITELLNTNGDSDEYKKGFIELFKFFMWIRSHRKQLLKDRKMYNEKIKTLDLDLLNELEQLAGGISE